MKLHGLYDHDHRRIRHSTLDEIPVLVSASALGTLTLDGLLALSPAPSMDASAAILVAAVTLAGSLVARAGLRAGWHRLTGMANGIVIGSPPAVEMIARRVAIHPETRLRLVGYLGPDRQRLRSDACPGSGAISEIPEIARDHEVERVVVAEDDMSDAQAERMIRDCKVAGLALTFLPRHHGLLGPGVELNRLAELPVLDFRFSDPPRSTMVLKRAMDFAIAGALLILLSPVFLVDLGADPARLRPPVFFRQAPGREARPAVHDAEVPHHGLRRRDDARRAGRPRPARRAGVQDPQRPAGDPGRAPSCAASASTSCPQLLNVLRGEMSLVGPRPEEEAVVALYDERQRARLSIKPGLTGPMQIYGRGDLTFEERLALERDYLDNLSFAGDLAILMRTPLAIIRGDGAY